MSEVLDPKHTFGYSLALSLQGHLIGPLLLATLLKAVMPGSVKSEV